MTDPFVIIGAGQAAAAAVETPLERLLLKPSSFYEKTGAELRVGVRAEGLNLGRREVRLSSGERLTGAVAGRSCDPVIQLLLLAKSRASCD
jgi:NADPH-dependent 2,4-dienoyl-CoA reductase/sulfur reductase-like enzyme